MKHTQIQDFFPECGWGVQRIPLFAQEGEVLCEVQKIDFFRGTDSKTQTPSTRLPFLLSISTTMPGSITLLLLVTSVYSEICYMQNLF